MKILAQAVPDNTIAGFQRAAEHDGHTWVWWEEQHTPTFDVFDEVKPDMLFFMETTRSLEKCVVEHNVHTIQGDANNPFTFRLKTTTSKEPYVFPCDRLVDAHMFCPGDKDDAYICDIGITCEPCSIGVNLCYPVGNVSVKVMCETPWGVPQYLGNGSLADKCALYRSANIIVVDSMMEAMRVMSCGSIPVSVNPEVSLSIKQTEPEEDELHLIFCPQTAPDVIDFHTTMTKTNQGVKVYDGLQTCLMGHTYDDALKVIMGEVQ